MLPNFIIIGAEKCGTTSLYHYLRQHPSVFMCTPKEPDYFSGKDHVDAMEAYEALFEHAAGKKAVGEASVSYLHSAEAPARIKEMIPDVRLLAVLRDPAERAYSHYNMMVAHGAIPNRPFLDVLEEARREEDYAYTGIPTSRYAESLQRYFDLFGEEQLRIYLFENFKKDPLDVMRSIFTYLDVDPAFEPGVNQRYNKTYLPKNDWLNRFIWEGGSVKAAVQAVLSPSVRKKLSQFLQRTNRSPVPPLSEEARSIITEVLRDDIERTEDLLERDLSHWKQVDTSKTEASEEGQ